MSTEGEPAPYKPEGRSVNDFDAEEDLRMALMNMNLLSRDDCHDMRDSAPEGGKLVAKSGGPFREGAVVDQEEGVELEEEWDWTVTNYDAENSDPQTIAREVQRLQVLKSYQIVGAEREEAFDRICNIGSRIFDCCTTFVVLLDLGRQWFASTHGLGDLRETPRKVGFCQHTILFKGDVLVVPDCSKDFRFRDNAYVKDAPHLRFYAGAPLLSPEGFKLGTFCIVDTKPHPHGLTDNEEANLKDLAGMAMKAMIDRRELRRKVSREFSQIVASAAHDLMTPLRGMQVSLKTLQEDEAFKSQLGDHQENCLSTTLTSAQMMEQICSSTLDVLEGTQDDKQPQKKDDKQQHPSAPAKAEEVAASENVVVNVQECVQRIHTIINPVPKNVPLIMSVEQDIPIHIMSNDQMILRACLNLLSNACKRTAHGKIQFRVFQREGQLIFECEDSRTNKGIAQEESEMDCFDTKCQPSKVSLEDEMSPLGLSSLASQVNTLGGKYGYRSRGLSTDDVDANGRRKKGVYFWFSVPIVVPDPKRLLPQIPQEICIEIAPTEKEVLEAEFQPLNRETPNSVPMNLVNANGASDSPPQQPSTASPMVTETPSKPKRKKRALVIEDSLVVRNSIARALTKKGYEVFQATDGVQGLQHLQDRIHDVTFCDFMMPNLDGTECVRKYRDWEKEHRPQFSQYIIGISAYAKQNDIGNGLQAGMNEYKAKPMTTKVITELCQGTEVQKLSSYLDRVPFEKNQFIFPVAGKREEPAASDGKRTTITRSPVRRTTTRTRDEMELEVIGIVADNETQSRKRVKVNELIAIPQGPDVCLLATQQFSPEMDTLAKNIEAMGWKVFGVSERDQVLQVMKLRRWGAVLLFDDLNLSGKGGCVTQFREWEESNRSYRQDNVYLVRGCGVYPSSGYAPQVSPGFDGELDRSFLWEHLKGKLGSPKHDALMHEGGWNVVTS